MIPCVELIRLEENETYGTFGALKIQKQVFCVTLEPPDYENMKDMSSIPVQQYTCELYDSPNFGVTYQVLNVPFRTHVMFHPGNLVTHTRACIITAQHWGVLGKDRAVLNSGATFRRFMKFMEPYKKFHLTVKEEF